MSGQLLRGEVGQRAQSPSTPTWVDSPSPRARPNSANVDPPPTYRGIVMVSCSCRRRPSSRRQLPSARSRARRARRRRHPQGHSRTGPPGFRPGRGPMSWYRFGLLAPPAQGGDQDHADGPELHGRHRQPLLRRDLYQAGSALRPAVEHADGGLKCDGCIEPSSRHWPDAIKHRGILFGR